MESPRQPNARSLLLDLLRASEPDAWPVKVLVEVAALFGISENALRVNLTRLLKRGLLAQDNRGYYRLAPATGPLQQWVEAWWLGEARVREWRGGWLCAGIDSSLQARQVAPLARALHRLGFREMLARYWVRPDNLALDQASLFGQIAGMGGSSRFVLSATDQLLAGEEVADPMGLWPRAALEQQYRTHLSLIENSLDALRTAPIEQVLRDTFLLGGETIRVLAMDPLLPDTMVDTGLRSDLSEAMRAYDDSFRANWREHFGVAGLNRQASA